MKIEEGVMVVKNGKAWGCTYEDGQSFADGWVRIEDAPIHHPDFCTKVTDVTYSTSNQVGEIKTGKLVKVVRRTEVIIGECIEEPKS